MKIRSFLFLFFSFLLITPIAGKDQLLPVKKLLKDAKTALKNKRDQAVNEQLLLQALKRDDLSNRDKAVLLYYCQEMSRSVNDQENMKAYLRQPFDTVAFFSSILRMNEYIWRYDSLEKVTGETYGYQKNIKKVVHTFRKNLLEGGKVMQKKRKYAEAFPYFDFYLRHPKMQMFKDDSVIQKDTLIARVSYWATIAAYEAKKTQEALQYIDYAIEGIEPGQRPALMEYKANCLRSLNDTAGFLGTLRKGLESYPEYGFFYLNMMEHYIQADSLEKGILLSDTMVQRSGDRAIYAYGKSLVYMSQGKYELCIASADHAIELDSTCADAYYNKAISYINMAVEFSKTMCRDVGTTQANCDRTRYLGIYRYAKVPMEQYRRLRPNDKAKWKQPLYEIYYNLNLGEELEEIESLSD